MTNVSQDRHDEALDRLLASRPLSAREDFTARTLAAVQAAGAHDPVEEALDEHLADQPVVASADFTDRTLACILGARAARGHRPVSWMRRVRAGATGLAAAAAVLVVGVMLTNPGAVPPAAQDLITNAPQQPLQTLSPAAPSPAPRTGLAATFPPAGDFRAALTPAGRVGSNPGAATLSPSRIPANLVHEVSPVSSNRLRELAEADPVMLHLMMLAEGLEEADALIDEEAKATLTTIAY